MNNYKQETILSENELSDDELGQVAGGRPNLRASRYQAPNPMKVTATSSLPRRNRQGLGWDIGPVGRRASNQVARDQSTIGIAPLPSP